MSCPNVFLLSSVMKLDVVLKAPKDIYILYLKGQQRCLFPEIMSKLLFFFHFGILSNTRQAPFYYIPKKKTLHLRGKMYLND